MAKFSNKRSFKRAGFEVDKDGNFKKSKKNISRKGYKPKAKNSGTPQEIRINKSEVDMIDNGFRVHIKPASVNDSYMGQKVRTAYYKEYIKKMKELLPKDFTYPPSPWKILFIFGLSRKNADWDNPIKPNQDILQDFYDFNDSIIYDGRVIKVVAGDYKEFLEFRVKTFNPDDEIIF